MDRRRIRALLHGVCLLSLQAAAAPAVEMTLDQAVATALGKTTRGRIIRGQEEVAGQQYQAQRINFMVPAVSINGSVPAFDVDQSYRFFGGANTKQLYNTRDLSFNSFIELRQSLITGGTVTASANLNADEARYPDTRVIGAGFDVDETLRRGFFDFRLDQPLFRPSAARKLLHDLADDRDIASADRREREGALRREVTEAYLGVLQLEYATRLRRDRLQVARLQAAVDSLKLQDGVIPEEKWLESASKRLDAELEWVNTEMQAREQLRQLNVLLDLGVDELVQPVEPVPPPPPADAEGLRRAWETTVAVRKADRGYQKAQRQAKFSASEHRISGDLQARYAFGKGNVQTEYFNEALEDDIDTKAWGLLLRVRIPVWDGGAGGAAVKAARFQAEQARLEFEQQRKGAEAEIVDLLNDLDVSYRRLGILERQAELAAGRKDIAAARVANGEISQIQYLESSAFHLEQKGRYLEELNRYLTLRIDLEYRFLDS
jgi:outer membrane protein TolC